MEQAAFGYADGYGGDKYNGLHYDEPMPDPELAIRQIGPGFLVRPEAAARQKEAERSETPPALPAEVPTQAHTVERAPYNTNTTLFPNVPPQPAVHPTRRIVARKTTGANISLDDINALREEIIRNLSSDGGEITVEITISASKPDGFSDGIIRSVRENSAQLGLEFNESDSA